MITNENFKVNESHRSFDVHGTFKRMSDGRDMRLTDYVLEMADEDKFLVIEQLQEWKIGVKDEHTKTLEELGGSGTHTRAFYNFTLVLGCIPEFIELQVLIGYWLHMKYGTVVGTPGLEISPLFAYEEGHPDKLVQIDHSWCRTGEETTTLQVNVDTEWVVDITNDAQEASLARIQTIWELQGSSSMVHVVPTGLNGKSLTILET